MRLLYGSLETTLKDDMYLDSLMSPPQTTTVERWYVSDSTIESFPSTPVSDLYLSLTQDYRIKLRV